VVDSYDAMTSRRNYRRNLTMNEAVRELQLCAGSQFDKETVDCFSRAIQDFVLTFHTSLSDSGVEVDLGE
jgi:HD-GYP domain-containing protein (c-di-GMP phosphodiesterase class II)